MVVTIRDDTCLELFYLKNQQRNDLTLLHEKTRGIRKEKRWEMKKSRYGEPTKTNPRFRKDWVKKVNVSKKIRGSYCGLSVPLFFTLWCAAILFHTKFGLTHGNKGGDLFFIILFYFLCNFLPAFWCPISGIVSWFTPSFSFHEYFAFVGSGNYLVTVHLGIPFSVFSGHVYFLSW